MMQDKSIFWKLLSAMLFTFLVLSWGYFQFTKMLNDSAFETLSFHRNEIRNINTQLVNMNIQLQDLQSKNKTLSEKVESYNLQRVRDHEMLSSQVVRPVRNVR
jgi:Tfp pilus assembly protein PilO